MVYNKEKRKEGPKASWKLAERCLPAQGLPDSQTCAEPDPYRFACKKPNPIHISTSGALICFLSRQYGTLVE